ncbi:MAG: PKD domain-containing protein [Daejeonella sp.]|uniref:gliding motility-associated C-terminal domain-containing protein n=1 Tax=Daejeonella sp. TaxID=2805397 RepID=UPI0027345510|nr:PKD domain-containing protein [Daejeonella sp.]MDP3468636.1 PKD domain-containing protein [Daejeonella sp.]
MKHIPGIVLIVFGLFAGLFQTASAQSTSNKGTDFWLAYGNHVAGYTAVIGQEMVVYITSDVSTSGVLEVGGTSIPFQVTANAITNVTVPQTAYIGNADGIVKDKGIHITSLLPIVVYAHIYDQAVSGATLVLPTNTLGKDYYSLNYQQISNSPNSHSFFFVVATEDNTEIVITPSVDTQGGLKAGIPSATIKLNKGEVYQVLGVQTSSKSRIVRNIQGQNVTQYTTEGGDLTGTRIQSVSTSNTESCKKIAVFSGSGKMAIGCLDNTGYAGSADNLFQQAYPTSSWGKTFITVPSKDRNYDVYRIFKSDPNAEVRLNGTVIPSASFTNNFYYEFAGQTVNNIESDKAIQVVLYAVTQGKSINCTNVPGDVGDPEMIFLNPLEQTLSQITMYSTQLHMIIKHFINVVIPQSAVSSFTIDGVSQASYFQSVTGKPEYAYAQIPVSAGTHNLQANAGFNAIAYGFGNAESYGYAAGANVKGLGVEIRKATSKKQVSTVCVKEELNLSVKLFSTTNKLLWDLGDGSAPFEILNPVPVDSNPIDGIFEYLFPNKVIYNELKDYKIVVTSNKTSSDGCGSIEITELQFSAVNPPSSVITVVGQTCVNAATTFTDASMGNGKNITKWLWDFGDNEFSTDQNPVHTYAKSGDYTVKLMVEGETGCQSDVITQIVHVVALPVVNFNSSIPVCASQDVTFSDISSTSEGKIIKWTWDFGDGKAIEERNSAVPFTHNFSASGTYKVILKVLTDKGCESVAFEKSILINPTPLVNFGVPEVCIKDVFAQFTDSTTISDGSELTYLWNFGNAAAAPGTNTSTLKNPTHRYTVAGNYQVSLTVTSKTGCVSTLVKTFTVNGAIPKADFVVLNAEGLCSNKEVVFRNKSFADFGSIGKIEWYFDYDKDPANKVVDENPVPDKEYRFTYPVFSSQATKPIRVRKVAYSGGICFDDDIQTITLLAAPSVSFSPMANICQEVAPFRITQASELSGQMGVGTYSGPGLSSTGIFNPAQAGVGTHTLQYLFTSTNGCSESITQTITVMPTPSVNAGKDTLILEGGETKLNAVASGTNLTYKWFPSTGLSRDDIPDPVASPVEDITYTLTVTSDQACVSRDNILVKVLKQPEVPNAFSPNNDGMNDLWNVKYLESYANATVKVFSRYGGIVYQSNKGYAIPWNGQFNGIDLPVGTYYYIIDPKTKGRKVISGAVTILR